MDTKTIIKDFENSIKADAQAIKERLDWTEGAIREMAQKQDTGMVGAFGTSQNHDPLSAIVQNQGVQAMASNRGVKTASVDLAGNLKDIFRKALVTGDVQSSTDQLYVQPAFDSRLGEVQARRLTLLDILPSIPVASNSFQFNRLDGYSDAAAIQTVEGAEFAAGSMPTELVTAEIATIAHYVKFSAQVLDDQAALRNQASLLLRYGVSHRLTAELIAGNGKIKGLAEVGTTYGADAGTSLPDAIAGAISTLQTNGWEPNGILMHPHDWTSIRTSRETSEGGTYLLGAPSVIGAMTLWGVPVIVDPSVLQGQPLVMDSNQVALLDRLQARVEFGREGSDFVEGKITALGEVRAGLAVFSPSAVLVISVASA